MIYIKNTEIVGVEASVRAIRHSTLSRSESDSDCWYPRTSQDLNQLTGIFKIGDKDYSLITEFAKKQGSYYREFMKMIVVYCDIEAPMYWWQDLLTYNGVVNSRIPLSTSNIHEPDLSLDALRYGNLAYPGETEVIEKDLKAHYKHLMNILSSRHNLMDLYSKTNNEKYLRCMIEMLPASYNQLSTVMFNYETLSDIYTSCKHNNLTEWKRFCEWIEDLPYSELITGGNNND